MTTLSLSRLTRTLRNTAGAFKSRLSRGGLTVSRSVYDGFWMTWAADGVIGRTLRKEGRWEEGQIDTCRSLLAALGQRPPGGTFLDIGANIGTHAIFALRHGFDRAVCFEPDPANLAPLIINQTAHGVYDRCTNVPMALGQDTRFATITLSRTNFGDQRVGERRGRPGGDRHPPGESHETAVACTSFDSWAEATAFDLSAAGLAWIDVQGYEGHVLEGARSLMDVGCPIVIEFWPRGLRQSGGYPILREILSRMAGIYDVNAFAGHGQTASMPLAVLDTLASVLDLHETSEGQNHTDLLLLPN